MATRGNIDRLYALSTEQWGLFTSAQALSVHVSRNQLSRMVADGRLEPMAYGVYRVAAGGETEHAAVKAAWLSLYPSKTAFERLGAFPYDAVATGRTAAYMQSYGDFYETPYCFIVDRKKRSTREDLELVHAPVERQDIDLRLGIPVATPERTLADLVRLDEDPSLVNDYIASAALSGHTFDERRLAILLEPLCRRRGSHRPEHRCWPAAPRRAPQRAERRPETKNRPQAPPKRRKAPLRKPPAAYSSRCSKRL